MRFGQLREGANLGRGRLQMLQELLERYPLVLGRHGRPSRRLDRHPALGGLTQHGRTGCKDVLSGFKRRGKATLLLW